METSILIRRLTGTGEGKEETLHTQEISLGTGPGSTVRFDPTWDRGVATSHARVWRDEAGTWWLQDAGSSTGTFVNGQRINTRRKVGGPTVIELGQNGPKVEVMLPAMSAASPVGGGAPAHQEQASSGAGKWLALAACLAAVAGGGWFMLNSNNGTSGSSANASGSSTAKSDAPYADSDEKLRQLAKKYEQAVGVVVMAEQGSGSPSGTAWAVGTNTFATNSHITEVVEPLLAKGGAAFVVINKHPELRFRVLKAVTHPKYYSDAKAKAGQSPPLNLDGKPQQIGAYDVGLLIVDGDPPVKFALAGQEKLESLDSGHRVAFLGFPMENLTGGNIDMHYPVATMQSGIITSVTDAWMASASSKDRILIHHNLPSAGGASGSPVFDVDGEVVGLHSAGNYTMGLSTAAHRSMRQDIADQIRQIHTSLTEKLKDQTLTPEQRQQLIAEAEGLAQQIAGAPLSVLQMNRVTSASLINFAQRADMLQELLSAQGNAAAP